MTNFLAWERRSHEPRRKAIGSRFMRTRFTGQEEICDVIIEVVYWSLFLDLWKPAHPATSVNMIQYTFPQSTSLLLWILAFVYVALIS
jgi:hypothetical protein